MKSRALAVLLIVVGIGATLGGLYGQIFLAEDEGHHDGREVSFALTDAVGAYELSLLTDGSTVTPQLEQAGQPVTSFDGLHGTDGPHLYVVNQSLDAFQHLTPTELGTPIALAGSAPHRVVLQAAPSGGTDLLELGVTTVVEGDPAPGGQNITDDDEWSDGSLTVRRQGFDFVLSEPWNGNDVFEGPAFLTVYRAENFAFTHAHAELVGDNRFSFAADLPGVGDYLAAVEFEQNGELVTALFRFSI